MKWKWKKRKKGKIIEKIGMARKSSKIKRIKLDNNHMNEQEEEGNNKENWNRTDRNEQEKGTEMTGRIK
jgi:ribosomal protein S16